MSERIILDMTGRGGLAPKWGGDINSFGYDGYQQTGTPNLRYDAGDNQVVSGIYDFIKKRGFMSPSYYAILDVPQDDLDQTIDNDFQSSLIDPIEEKIYFFEQNGDIVYGSYDGSDFEDHSPSPTTQITDSAIYYKNGVRTIYVACNISGSPSSAVIREFAANADPSTININWSSDDVVNGFDLYNSKATRLIPSGDGFMYILNKNAVHRVDGTVIGGTEGTIYRDILLGPSESYLTHGVEYNNYMYIAVQNNEYWDDEIRRQDMESLATHTSNVGVYIWNRQSTFFNSSNFVELPGVSYVKNIWVTPRNELMLMAIVPNGEVCLMKFNGSRFSTVETMPWGAHVNNKSAMQIHGYFTYWIGSDSFIYRYGSDNPQDPEVLTILGKIANNGVGFASAYVMSMVSVNMAGTLNTYYEPNKRQTVEVMYIVGEPEPDNYIFKRFIPYATGTIGFPH